MITLIIRNQKEAKPLYDLALRTAGGTKEPLSLLVLNPQGPAECDSAHSSCPSWIRHMDTPEVASIHVFGGATRYQNALQWIKQSSTTLLILGKHLHTKRETEDTRFSRHIYHTQPCQTLLVRLGEQQDIPHTDAPHAPLPSDPSARSPILVACGWGSHTRRALRLAHALAGPDTVALHMTADVDPASREYAQESLSKIITKAGLDPSVIVRKTALGTDLPKILRQEVTEGHQGTPYSILLMGESQTRGLKEKLFGTVPDKLINKSDGLTLAVIRAERPVGHRIRDTLSRMVRLNIPQLKRGERLSLFEEIERKSLWSFDFAALMTLAALVAGLGLLANSGAVVIGAMLIAPLMMPLIGSGLALAQGNGPLFRRALSAVLRGFIFALCTGLLLGVLGRLLHLPLTGELSARGNPTLLDLGVAFISGIAASYCIARPTLSGALAGVAIAAALVPPICTVGICIAMGELSVAKGASLLFGTNVVAVILGSALNFSLGGIRGQGKTGETGRRLIILLALVCLGLAIPLSSVLIKQIPSLEAAVENLSPTSELQQLLTDALPQGASLHQLIRQPSEHGIQYTLIITAPTPASATLHQDLLSCIQQAHPHEPVQLITETRLTRR